MRDDDGYPLTFTCEQCGLETFSPTRRRRRFCSTKCSHAHYNRSQGNRSGDPGTQSCTITVRYHDNDEIITAVGYGRTKSDARQDAESKLMVLGDFEEIGFVTPDKILRDLRRTQAAS